MDFSELVFQSKVLERRKSEEFKNQMVCAAFIGWQSYIAEGGKGTFSSYLSDMGLSDCDEKTTDEERKKISKRAYDTGERVMNMFKGKI